MNPIIKDALEKAEDAMPDTIPLEEKHHPVLPLTQEMLPAAVWNYVRDVSHRAQCPADFTAVAALCGLASMIGRKRILQPKTNDDWQLVANLWGAAVGGPSAMKSPALKAGLDPVHHLERDLIEAYKEQNTRRTLLAELKEDSEKDNKKQAKEKFNSGDIEAALKLMGADVEDDQPVTSPRLIVNDATVEKLGELLNENPNGLLMFRDELSGHITKLNSDDHQAERTFYLECYDANRGYTWDRIVRGTVHVEYCNLSIVGGIQPSRLGPTLSNAISGKGDDGFVQRFQLAIYPEVKKGKKWHDIAPNAEFQAAFKALFEKLYQLEVTIEADRILRFDPVAQQAFADWWEVLQTEIESPETAPILQSHYGKMPKTIGALAVIFHLCEAQGPLISAGTLHKALKWWPYLKSHATRIYGIVDDQSLANAKKLLTKRADLTDGFTVRDIRRKGWGGMKDNEQIDIAIDLLVDHNFLIEILPTAGQSGRPTTTYRWSPKLDRKPASPAQVVDQTESDKPKSRTAHLKVPSPKK